MESLGYHVRWYSWVLRLPEGATIPERPLPEGYTVRAATESEYEPAYHVTEDAFLEWAVREREATTPGSRRRSGAPASSPDVASSSTRRARWWRPPSCR